LAVSKSTSTNCNAMGFAPYQGIIIYLFGALHEQLVLITPNNTGVATRIAVINLQEFSPVAKDFDGQDASQAAPGQLP